jgi:hypothetical protein
VHEFGAFCVGVVFAECFDFGPLDFGAVLVEEPTFGLRIFAFFADETWFAALGVDADIFGDVAVWAIGLLLDEGWHVIFCCK